MGKFFPMVLLRNKSPEETETLLEVVFISYKGYSHGSLRFWKPDFCDKSFEHSPEGTKLY